jgi:hypothetical protein
MKASGRSKERGIVFIRNIRQSAVSILPICNGHAVNCISLPGTGKAGLRSRQPLPRKPVGFCSGAANFILGFLT